MDIIRGRNNCSEIRTLVEQRNTLSWPGTSRPRYDHQSPRTVFAPSRLNNQSREEMTEIDAKRIRRANRVGGGYKPIPVEEEELEEKREEGEIEQKTAETEEIGYSCDAIIYQLSI